MSSATREPRVGKSFGPRLSPAAEDLVGSFPLDWVTHPNTLVHSRYGRAGTLKPRWRRIEPRLPMHLLCSGRRSGPAQVVRAFLALDGTIVRSVDCTFAVFDETRNLRSFLPMHGRIARLKPSAPAVRSSWTQHSGVLPLFIVRRGARRIVRHELLVQHTGTASKTDLQVAPTSEMFCTRVGCRDFVLLPGPNKVNRPTTRFASGGDQAFLSYFVLREARQRSNCTKV